MSRKAASKNILQKFVELYESDKLTKDVADTLGGAVIAATGQALFTDMTPAEIAAATAMGAGTAFAVRPLGAYAGRKLGEGIESRIPAKTSQGIDERLMGITSVIPGTPGSLKLYKDIPGMETFAKAGYNQNFTKDGVQKSMVEGLPNLLGRQYSDAVAQSVVALTTPMMFGKSVDESKSEEIAKLEQALAELRGEVSSAITQ